MPGGKTKDVHWKKKTKTYFDRAKTKRGRRGGSNYLVSDPRAKPEDCRICWTGGRKSQGGKSLISGGEGRGKGKALPGLLVVAKGDLPWEILALGGNKGHHLGWGVFTS